MAQPLSDRADAEVPSSKVPESERVPCDGCATGWGVDDSDLADEVGPVGEGLSHEFQDRRSACVADGTGEEVGLLDEGPLGLAERREAWSNPLRLNSGWVTGHFENLFDTVGRGGRGAEVGPELFGGRVVRLADRGVDERTVGALVAERSDG
jgi:hypothetical protein